jgi:hypothetical protein
VLDSDGPDSQTAESGRTGAHESRVERSSGSHGIPTTPESAATPADAPGSPRRELASLDEALRQSPNGLQGAPSDTRQSRRRDPDSGNGRHSAQRASTASDAEPSAGTERYPTRQSDLGDSAPPAGDAASTSEPDDGSDDGSDQGRPRPSRRERAEYRDLAAERDRLAAQVQQLQAAVSIPPEVYQQAIASRLPDEEFARLAAKKQREDLSGDYLTLEESQALSEAIRVREWSLPWYLDAQKKVSAWSESEWRNIQQAQADAIAKTMKARPYLEPERVARAGSWDQITEYFCDAAFKAGAASRDDEVEDLKAGHTASRTRGAASGRALERGGVSGRAFDGVPDFRSSSGSDLLEAAFRREAQQQRRRAGAR